MKNLITIIVLTIIFTVCPTEAVTAQVTNQNLKESGNFASDQIYTGTEISAGRLDSINTMRWNNTYVLTVANEGEMHSLSVSLNYYNSLPNGGSGFAVMSGTWSLVVFRDNAFAGTLYGEVSGGSICFVQNEDGETISKRTNVTLQGKGGTGIFKKREYQLIRGNYDATTDFSSKQTRGTLNLNY